MMKSRLVNRCLRYLAAAVLGGFLGYVGWHYVIVPIIMNIKFNHWGPHGGSL
jgi:hypothetical protein